MKHYNEYKNTESLAKALKLPKAQAEKIDMRTDLVVAIKKAVEKKSLTHLEASKRARVGRTVMTALMNGNTTHISTDRLISIAQNLGLTVTLKVA